MSALQVTRVSKAFGGTQAVSDVDVEIRAGSIHGLIGPNGAGKTTLLNIISGFVKPDQGSIHVAGQEVTKRSVEAISSLGLARTFQDGRLLDDLTVEENLWVGYRLSRQSGGASAESTTELFATLGIEREMRSTVKELSAGQRKAVEIGRALLASPKVLLMDEPFSGLTHTEVTRLSITIRELAAQRGCAIVLVEHNLGAVFDICEEVTAMDRGRVLMTASSPEVSTSGLVREAFFGVTATTPAADAEVPAQSVADRDRVLLRATDLRTGYGRLEVIHGVSLEVAAGEVVALVGVNGAGKTTLVEALAGLRRIRSGSLEIDGVPITARRAALTVRNGVSCVSQHRNLFASLSARDNLQIAARGSGAKGTEADHRVDEVIEKIHALGPLLERRAGLLSGGQKQILAIARALVCRPRILLLDEPSTGLSVGALAELSTTLRTLAESGVTMLVAEQNVSFARAICHRAIVLQHGEIVATGGPELLDDVWNLVATAAGDNYITNSDERKENDADPHVDGRTGPAESSRGAGEDRRGFRRKATNTAI